MTKKINWQAEWESVCALRLQESARRDAALAVIERHGQTDGAHHKQWVIDQVVRHLLGCPTEIKAFHWPGSKPYVAEIMGENDSYKQWVKDQCSGVDGPKTYDYDQGIAP